MSSTIEQAHPRCGACAEIAGELIAKTRRHCESLSELTPAEAQALPRTAAMPRGHVISDIYRRARNLLRKLRVLRNPAPATRADAATRIRQLWRA
jgi:hypothetical protein